MLKLLATTSLFFAFTLGMTAMAVAQAIPPPRPPSTSYELPGVAGGYNADRFREGRSIYQIDGSSIFYGGTDERGYSTGDPQIPRTGD